MITMMVQEHEHYSPHHEDVSIINEHGTLCGRVAWWSDFPINDAILEARRCVLMLENFGVVAKRTVLHKGNPVFTAELHPLRAAALENEKWPELLTGE